MSESGPLSGKNVVVTRAREQAGSLLRALQEAGANAILLPMIELAPPDSFDSLDHVIHILTRCDWIVFTSANGVRAFFDRLREKGLDGRALAGCSVAAVGDSTAAHLRSRGVDPDVVPRTFQASALIPLLPQEQKGVRTAVVRAAAGRDELIEELRRRGGRVEVAVAYQTRAAEGSAAELLALVDRDGVDCVTFTSGSTVTSFFAKLDEGRWARLIGRAAFVSIGPSTSDTMRRLGIPVTAESASAEVEALRDAVVASLASR